MVTNKTNGSLFIYCANCFSRLKAFAHVYNRVLMNPPFSQKDIELKFVYETLTYFKIYKQN